MPWVRFDDRWPENRKVKALSDAAFRLDAEAICWAGANTTDGVIRADELTLIGLRGKPRNAAELVKRGRWHRADDERCSSPTCPPPGPDGWVIHDYWQYQPSKAKVQREREAKAKRQATWLARKDAPQDAVIDASRDVSIDVSRDIAPTRPDPTRTRSGHLGEGNSPGVARENANPHPQRPPEHCDKHPGGTSAPCGRCGDARRAAEQWDTDDAKRAELIAAELEQVRADPRARCAHGTDGGSYPHPQTGEPLCALCRHAERTSA